MKSIKIGMVAPPQEDITGPAVMVQNLTEALVRLGVDVTLLAPGDWKTSARHVVTLTQSLRKMRGYATLPPAVVTALTLASQVKVLSDQERFDLIHLHLPTFAYAIGLTARKPCLLSLHRRLEQSRELVSRIRQAGIYPVALSCSQRGALKIPVIRNGVPTEDIKPGFQPRDYFIAVSRLHPGKGVDTAIRLARRAKVKLIIIGPVGSGQLEQKFYRQKIKPHLDQKQIIYKGRTNHATVLQHLREARAFIFTARQPDVCPMLIGEVLACGTPIIGTRIPPLPEQLGGAPKVARLSNDPRKLVDFIRSADQIFDRAACRAFAEHYFSSTVMAHKYLNLYRRILRVHDRKRKK